MTIRQKFIYAWLGLGTIIWIITFIAPNTSIYNFKQRSTSAFSGCSVATMNSSSHNVGRRLTTALVETGPNALRNPFDTCILPQFDPWDANIVPYVNPDYDPLQKCNRSFKPMTTLKNGIVTVNKKNVSCMGRCLTRMTEFENKVGEWINVNDADFHCDIVETSCLNEKGNETYRMVHMQIAEVNNTEEKKIDADGNLYSVYVILLDSTAHTQAIRNLPRTMHFFENSMQAVSFPHINKVGMNSRPNGIALWFGKLLELVDRKLFGLPDIQPDWTYQRYCRSYLDNETFLFREFSDRGYKTLLGEDSGDGVLTAWPKCLGFNKQQTDHDTRAFHIAWRNANDNLKKTYNIANCFELHRDMLLWLQDFINAYGNTPKFGWIWLSVPGHSHESGSIHVDSDLFRFLLRNKKKLDSSFVVILGDHGLRFGKVTHTNLGSFEVNNPLFSISIPKTLREETDILDVLRENTARLQTTFDIRATLLDILKYQPAANFTDRKYMVFKGEYGTSLMRTQPEEERTCKNLYIPLSHCTCRYPLKEVNRTSQVATDAGIFLVNHINNSLEKEKFSAVCEKLKYKHTISISAYVPEEVTKTYRILVKVMPPCDGEFTTVVRQVNGTTWEMASGTVDRLDSYGNKGDCVTNFKHLCQCIIKTKSTTTNEKYIREKGTTTKKSRKIIN